MMKSNIRSVQNDRRGATSVEMAMVAPLLLMCVFAFMEFGLYFMTANLLNGAAQQAARLGISDGVTTARVVQKAESIVSAALPTSEVSVYVKDASPFDAIINDRANVDNSMIDYETIDDIELAHSKSNQLFVVRLEVDYNDVGFLGRYFADDIKVQAQSFMRHE